MQLENKNLQRLYNVLFVSIDHLTKQLHTGWDSEIADLLGVFLSPLC